MKNLILFLLLITVTRFYAQNEGTILKYNGLLNSTNIKVIQLENEYQSIFDEITNFEPSLIESNSEGKFLKYSFYGIESVLIENVSEQVTDSNSLEEKSIAIVLNGDFVTKLTQKFSSKANNSLNSNDNFFKFDKEIMTDKLNKVVYEDDFSIQIGKNIYEYIQKLHKSDIDKTFANELNLLVFNF
jgi:hypothetical protein